jgi:hypothetical protein
MESNCPLFVQFSVHDHGQFPVLTDNAERVKTTVIGDQRAEIDLRWQGSPP